MFTVHAISALSLTCFKVLQYNSVLSSLLVVEYLFYFYQTSVKMKLLCVQVAKNIVGTDIDVSTLLSYSSTF